MANVLVVDEEPNVLRKVEHCLSREGCDIYTAMDGQQAIGQFQRHEPDLVILDIALPKVDGFQVCRTIRETSSIPIIILSVRRDEADKIIGFNLGVDDYITKPFSSVELCLRVRALLRRTKLKDKTATAEGKEFSHNGLYVNPFTREVTLDHQPIELTAKEFDLLWYLIKNPNKVFTRKQLLYQIWQSDYIGSDDTITVLVSRLRKKLQRKKTGTSPIHTLRGVGYKFVLE